MHKKSAFSPIGCLDWNADNYQGKEMCFHAKQGLETSLQRASFHEKKGIFNHRDRCILIVFSISAPIVLSTKGGYR